MFVAIAGGFYKLCVYLLVGAICLIPLYFILIPLIIGVGIHRVKHGIALDDFEIGSEEYHQKEKEIQWIVREETRHERKR